MHYYRWALAGRYIANSSRLSLLSYLYYSHTKTARRGPPKLALNMQQACLTIKRSEHP